MVGCTGVLDFGFCGFLNTRAIKMGDGRVCIAEFWFVHRLAFGARNAFFVSVVALFDCLFCCCIGCKLDKRRTSLVKQANVDSRSFQEYQICCAIGCCSGVATGDNDIGFL